ncbi:MAG TPA: glycosyltransferase [Longimicrobiales bacterium]|nr:glycosyltransferase [Longimicrobiales bacterium]
MRILYIVSAYSRSGDDVITPWLSETIRRLRGRGVDVEVLAPSYRGLADQVIDGVPVHRFRYAPSFWEDLTHDQTAPDRVREKPLYLGLVPGYVAAGSLAAARLARSGRFDAVHVHWPIPHGILGLAAKRAGRIPLVSTFHGVELTWVNRDMRVLRPLLRRMIALSDAVTANSSYTARLVQSFYDRPVARIPFGATIGDPVQPERSVASPDPARAFRLLFVGRLVERKGVGYLLDALSRARTKRPVTLDVVGGGPLEAELDERALQAGLGDRVRFHGFVPKERLASFYAAADAFVLPAVSDAKGDVEGLGVVLIEASGFGLPLIASDAGGIPDVVRDQETGLLVPPGDADALARAIARLADSPELAARLGRAGAAFVAERFSWNRIIDDLQRLYARLTESDVA